MGDTHDAGITIFLFVLAVGVIANTVIGLGLAFIVSDLKAAMPTAKNNNAMDKSQDLDWKRAHLALVIDTACATPGEHRARCATLYDQRKTCERGVQLWTSLARATGWSYDPWAMAAPDVLLDRLGKWVAHPGYHGAC